MITDYRNNVATTAQRIEVNHRANSFLIAHALQRCASCSELTPAVALLLPADHETLEEDGESDNSWFSPRCQALVFFIEYISEHARVHLQRLSSLYWLDRQPGSPQHHWMNHCASCGAQQEDTHLYCEPDGTFALFGEGLRPEEVALHLVQEPCAVRAGGWACAA
jgi:hypothetical protein